MQNIEITNNLVIFIYVMTKKEFQQELKSSANIAVQRANKFLERLGLSLHINWDYDSWEYNDLDNAIGVYERDSVFGGDISIGFNIKNLYKVFVKETKNHPWSDPYTILDEAIQTNVFHEMGHGIVQMINDYLQETDELDEIYDNNQELFDNVLDNEEDSVEEFAWAMYDNQLNNSKLYKIIQLYLNLFDNQNSLNEANKVGGQNYANRGDSFYTQEKDIVNELSHYDLRGKIVYCNCDNPTMSNFYKFFKSNFNNLGLKGLYATYYDTKPMMFFFNGSQETSQPISSGRFQDNGEIMKRCDIVITNPPFSNSMASELVKMAQSYGKHVIMVGPLSMAYQKEMFELIKNNQLNMGYTTINKYNKPGGESGNAPTAWWTTMNVNRPSFQTGVKFNPTKYQKYDNFDAIDIPVYDKNLPDDYYGYMGVSPRMLRVLNRNQFDIIRKIRPVINGKVKNEKYIIKRKNPQQNLAESLSDRILEIVHNVIFENFSISTI